MGKKILEIFGWRKEGDLNPRYPERYAAFRVRCIQPLCHLSVRSIIGKKFAKASVKVEIKAPNYSNLLLAVMEESIADTFNGKEVKQSDVEKNLAEKIKNSKAETRSGQINLTKKDNEWKIKSDDDITNLLLGEADEKESVMFSK